ncbi:MAG: mechanosensitive ion channel [Xenococcaceae cyanobacterium MO_234.B1]|nr:mechanosensitive ion channel [Xenococcaceae cyanobacterium MO_234.B1]
MDIAPFLEFVNSLLLTGSLALLGFLAFPKLSQFLLERFASSKIAIAYKDIVEPSSSLIQIVFGLAIADILLLLLRPIIKTSFLEITLGLSVAITLCYLAYQMISRFFRLYVEESVSQGRKLDASFFLLSKILASLAIFFVVITIFAETHEIDIFGLLASIGIGGVAIAFAAQTILEQIIGGFVLFFDSPFALDDYIKLPDGTFGRVESIGLRLTKIRTSGKGTLVSVPNNVLAKESVENFTNAGKIMAIVDIRFPQGINVEEQSLIRQVIVTGTRDIWGIDPRSTAVNFSNANGNGERSPATRGQVSLFILSSGNEVSMELRRQLLDIASNKIAQKLTEYGVTYEIGQPRAYIDSPMSI